MHANLDRCAERHQLDRVEPGARRLDDRKSAMRVDVGIAVSRKMLRGSQDVLALHSPNECGHVAADLLRILAETPGIDHRVVGIDRPLGARSR